MPGSAIPLTKEEMDCSWEQKVSKNRAHHAKMHSRIHKMQSEYQRNLDAFDLEHRRRMEAAEKRRQTLHRGRIVAKEAYVQRKTKKQRKKSVDAAVFNRKPLNRQLSHSADDISEVKAAEEIASSPQGCVCCPREVVAVKVEKKSESDEIPVEQPKLPNETDDENVFVRFLEWVGIMKEKDKEKAAAKDGGSALACDGPKTAAPESKTLMKQFGSLVANVGSSVSSSKAETLAPEVAPTVASSKEAPVSTKTGVTPSRNVLEPARTVLYVNITPSRKFAPSSVADANVTTPKTQGTWGDVEMYRGYVKETAAKFLAISEAQNGTTTPGSAKASPLPPKDPGQRKYAVSVVPADKMVDGSGKLITNGDSKSEIQIVINRL